MRPTFATPKPGSSLPLLGAFDLQLLGAPRIHARLWRAASAPALPQRRHRACRADFADRPFLDRRDPMGKISWTSSLIPTARLQAAHSPPQIKQVARPPCSHANLISARPRRFSSSRPPPSTTEPAAGNPPDLSTPMPPTRPRIGRAGAPLGFASQAKTPPARSAFAHTAKPAASRAHRNLVLG